MNQIYMLGKLEDRMQDIPDTSVHVIFADLPYVSGTRNPYNQPVDLVVFWEEAKRILYPGGVVALTADQLFSNLLYQSNPDWFRLKYYWIKNVATGGHNVSFAPLINVEEVLIFAPSKPLHYSPRMREGFKPLGEIKRSAKGENVYGAQKEHRSGRVGKTDRYPTQVIDWIPRVPLNERRHPAQKPVELAELFFSTYAPRGGITLDVSAGSGSSALASFAAGMETSICIEPNPVYLYNAMQWAKDECDFDVEFYLH